MLRFHEGELQAEKDFPTARTESASKRGNLEVQMRAYQHEQEQIRNSRDTFLNRYKTVPQTAAKDDSILLQFEYKDPSQFVFVKSEHKDVNSLPSHARTPYYTGYFHLQEGKIVITSAYRITDEKYSGGKPPHFSETLFNMQYEAAIHAKQDTSKLPVNEFVFHAVANQKTLDSLSGYLSQEQKRREFKPSDTLDFEKAMQTPFPKAVQDYLDQHKSTIPDGPKGISKIVIWRTPDQIGRLHMKIEVSRTVS